MFPVLPLVQVRAGALVGPPAGRGPEVRAVEPAEAALRRLARAAGEVVLVDLDGIETNSPDFLLLRDAARRHEIWHDGGAREASDVADAFVAGAKRVTVRWSLVDGLEELEVMADLAEPGALYLGLEFRDVFIANRRDRALGVEDLLTKVDALAMPVVGIDLGAPGAARRAVAAAKGERWYAAPLPAAEFAAFEAEGWTGGIGLPPTEAVP